MFGVKLVSGTNWSEEWGAMKGAAVTNMQKPLQVTEKLPGQAERLLRLEKG